MTLKKFYKNSKRQYYIIADGDNDIVRFDDLKTAAIVLRYLQGAELSEYERITALAALTETSSREG